MPLWPPEKIQINRPERQRTEIDTEELLESIKQHGQLQAIIVTHDKICTEKSFESFASICCCKTPILIAGERRLEACKQLGIPVEIKFLDNLSLIERRKIEYDENRRRKPLPWRDDAKAIVEMHNMYLAQDPNWTVRQTAQEIDLSQPTIANAILIVDNFTSPLLDAATSITQAGEIIKRFHLEKVQSLTKETFTSKSFSLLPPHLQPKLNPPPEPNIKNFSLDFPTPEQIIAEEEKLTISNMSLKTFINFNPTARYDIIHLDLSDKPPEIIQEIIQHKLIIEARGLLVWLKSQYTSWLINQLTASTFQILQPPIIWYKTDLPSSTYNKYKPKNVLQYFLSFILDSSLSFFDPFAKNGNSLLAAKALSAKSIFGLESNQTLCQEANEKLIKEKFAQSTG
jgi:ParB/RepB/Spo0J family partition protein